MKKIISRIIIIFIIIVILFEFPILNSNVSYASFTPASAASSILNGAIALGAGLVSIILWIPKLLVTLLVSGVDALFAVVASSEGTDGDVGTTITPFKIFFNKYELLSVNMFEYNGTGSGNFGEVFREQVATWYYLMRLIAVAILLAMLIYVGIRMAISTIAEDKAKYKKMLFDWVVGLALIFVMHYIAIFTVYCNDAIVNAIEIAYTTGNEGNAEAAITGIYQESLVGVGFDSIIALFVYIAIVAQTLFFLIAYINRVLKVGFLLIISPLITVTYSIDKMGDGKAQALGAWLKEYIYTILIQPFHCIIYYAFIETAFELIKMDEANYLATAVIVICCIKFIGDGEKIVRQIFGFADDNSKTGMAAGAVATVAIAKNSAKVGKTVKTGATKGLNFTRKFTKDAGGDLKKVGNAFKNSAIGQKATGLAGAAKDKIENSKPFTAAKKTITGAKGKATGLANNAKDKIGNSKAVTKAKKTINGAKGKIGDAKKFVGGKKDALKNSKVGQRLTAKRTKIITIC